VRRDPVGDGLVDDPEQPSDGALAHPFEREADGLFVDSDAMSLLLREGREVALASEAAVALGTGTIVTPLTYRRR
jgi:hypothetical protein